MRLSLAVAVAIAGMAMAAQPASAAWLEASSDHFIIYSDTEEAQLRQFATRLERFDKGLRQLFLPGAAEDEGRRSNRLRIFVVSGQAAVERLCGRCPPVLGFYVPRVGGSVIFTPRRTGYDSAIDFDAETVLFHEYAHHFMYANFSAAYPAWYSEGFAEFNATAQFDKDGALGFGVPAKHRAYSLFNGDVLSLEKLFDSASRRLDSVEREAIYSRGWLLTHYLTFNSERKGQLHAYLTAMNKGTPSLDAGKAAFGDLKLLNRELDRYLRSSRMKYVRLSPDQLPIGRIDIRPLSAGAAAMIQVNMRSTRGVSEKTARELVPEARRKAAPYPDDPVVQAQLAEAEFDAGNDAEAEAAADRALKADPNNIDALLYKGRVLTRRAATAKTTDEAVWKAARSWYLKANRVDPNAALPLFLFYDSFRAAGLTPTANAVQALDRAFELAPEDQELRFFLAHQALSEKNAKRARAALAPLAYNPHASGLREIATNVIALIDAGKIDEAAKAVIPSETEQADAGE